MHCSGFFSPLKATSLVLHSGLETCHSLSFYAWPLSWWMCLCVLVRHSRGSSFGLSGLKGHLVVIMTFDPCRPVCQEKCRRCLPSLRLMVSRWLFLLPSSSFLYSFFTFQVFLCCSLRYLTPKRTNNICIFSFIFGTLVDTHLFVRKDGLDKNTVKERERERYWLVPCLGLVRTHLSKAPLPRVC